MKTSALFSNFLAAAVCVALGLSTFASGAAPAKLSELIGHPVETDSGKTLGSIQDFSIDAKSGSLNYIVISVGSFLVENSLIAIEPSALSQAASGNPVVVRMEDLEVAHRFSADNWPDAADVRVASNGGSTDGASEQADNSTRPLSATGTATITSGSKKATYEDGKRKLVNGPLRSAKALIEPKPKPQRASGKTTVPNFKNLDRNRDGRLSRAEIGAQLNQRSGFKDLDVDANGSIDDFEYDAYRERLANQRRWVGNR